MLPPPSFILFLDFDGVCHARCSGSLNKLPQLEAALLPYLDDLGIVISSNWRYEYPVATMRQWFSHPISAHVIGATPRLPDGEMQGGRQREIEAWLALQPSKAWCAIDDDAMNFAPDCPWLIQTQYAVGLTDDTLQRLAAVIRQSRG